MRRALVCVLVVVAVACGHVPGQAGATPSLAPPSPPLAALERWKDFPAHASPRPIIAFGESVESIQPSGFPDNDRKIAWVCGKFVLANGVNLSTTPPSAVSAGGTAYPAISSARAYSELMAGRPPGGNPTDCASAPPFAITAVRLGTAGFPTDRGTMTLPAWLFAVPEVNAYLGHSAIDPSAYWGGGVSTEGRGVKIAADGLTLDIAVGNAEPGPCGSDYTASAAESKTAVAVALRQFPHAALGANVACPASLRISYITVRLKAPLGGRVLVDEQGNPGMVCPETGDC